MAKPKKRVEARKLRENGESIKEIARQLGVSPSTVSVWCRDIELTDSQIKKLEKRSRDPNYGERLRYSQKQRRERIKKTKRLKNEGIEEIGNLTKRELFLVGGALYWAEGFKKDSQAGLASSDPRMIKLILKWLRECCNYGNENLSARVTLNISHKGRIDEVEKYWSDVTGISRSSFQKPYYQKVKWKKTYENPNEYYGVLRIRVRKSTDFLRKIHGWIEGLSLQAG